MGNYKPESKKSEHSIARLKRDGKTFEVLVDCEIALKVRSGEASVSDALLVPRIFKDAHKGDVSGDLLSVFGTEDPLIIAKEIITKGDVQLTEEYRHKIINEKRNKILELVSSKAADPKTGYPVPRQRIELGMNKAGFKVRFERSVNEQVKELMDSLKKVMPITFKDIIVTISSPVQFTGQVFSVVKSFGEVIEQNYLPDGSLIIKIKLPAGKRNELSDKLKGLSHGLIKIKEDLNV